MNISLRQVRTGNSQTMFITSTGTVLFTSYMRCDQRGYQSTTVITSVDDQGSIVEVGLIKWNPSIGGSPFLCVGKGRIELRTTRRDDCPFTIFRGRDRQVYRWRKVNDVTILAMDGAITTPIAIACNDTQSALMVDSATANDVLCIQPTGFHLLYEVVATLIVFEQFCEKTRASHNANGRITSTFCRGTHMHSGEARIQQTKDSHWIHVQGVPTEPHETQGSAQMPRTRNRSLFRSAADLTGELFRRNKYPSAYGGFGDVWKCDWLKDSRVIEVAVKVVRTNLTGGKKELESKKISQELKVWVRLEHECVVPLYGISFDFGRFPAMVCPWLEDGTLSKYLELHEELQLFARLNLLSDVASGLHYLHGCGIVHGDLTGSNVLIKGNGKACLSDFGLSRIVMETTGSSYMTSTVRGSVRWAAPELFEIGEEWQKEKDAVRVLPDTESDVYSFGSTMLQALTGKVPYHYYKNDAQVLIALSRGLRPARPAEQIIEDVHWEFMQKCWVSQGGRANKHVRPSIEEVVDFLSLATAHSSRG